MGERHCPTTQKPSVADRISGAVWGQFVGDAFCLGSHWIYDLAELEQRFPGGPQGFEEPVAGHYHAGKRPGDLTHYGDGALLLLRSLRERSRFDASDFGSRFVSLIESPGYSDPISRQGYWKYWVLDSVDTVEKPWQIIAYGCPRKSPMVGSSFSVRFPS
ncbi:ADP-ribosylglycohydrolase family protein [Geotalea uraniireducens]|uniref:Uncharacterized protein n=1 Tax=Geotalea uraniireducens (strain Rf4) TaxID=351605 RepID=A5GBD3_GEOUR|nr:ADP-ribosylglycohydrolase family protein [Geotalea uraniireducens]ABQ25110.1 hypothetical protein Gura_0904 [Geotalea uraniireducens Rf4]